MQKKLLPIPPHKKGTVLCRQKTLEGRRIWCHGGVNIFKKEKGGKEAEDERWVSEQKKYS